jgi:hypothetical protein
MENEEARSKAIVLPIIPAPKTATFILKFVPKRDDSFENSSVNAKMTEIAQ